MSEYDDGLYVTNACYKCMKADRVCEECQDLKDSSQTDRAYQIVDEGNSIYPRQWLRPVEPVSGHDWTDREDEFLPQVVHIEDCMDENLALKLGESLDFDPKKEIACPWCQLVQLRNHSECFDCDRPLELNVR